MKNCNILYNTTKRQANLSCRPQKFFLPQDLWHVTHDTWHVTGGRRLTFSKSVSSIAFIAWKLEVTPDMWHMTPVTWYVTNYIWHMSRDTQGVVNIVSIIQVPYLKVLYISCLGRFHGSWKYRNTTVLTIYCVNYFNKFLE